MTLASFLLFMGCGRKSETVVPPPPQVTVSHPLQKEITDYAIFSGQTAAVEAAEIRARVEGWLEKIDFEPGSEVKEGDLLFQIDPRPFQAQVDQDTAMLDAKKADQNLAETNLARSEQLLEKAAISQLLYDQSKAQALVSGSQVGIAVANLEKANLDLAYTKVTAPINGRVSRNYVDRGNLVGAGERTLLTKIVDTSKIYFYFDLSERDYLKYRRMLPDRPDKKGRKSAKVHLQLADESSYPHEGKLDFAEPELDPNTGTLQARAIFDNKEGILTAGLFGRIRIPLNKREALLVPDLVIGITQAGRYVMVVTKENVAERRVVETGSLRGMLRVIEKGLTKDDRVVVNAIQRAQPGRKVQPKEKPISEEPKGKADKKASDNGEAEKTKKPRTESTQTSH